jgi:osmotically-inducible protein OsmY
VLDLVPSPTAVDRTITEAFVRNGALDADKLVVQSTNDTVTLSGTVSSWAAHDAAIDAAWWTPGVTNVVDHIAISY